MITRVYHRANSTLSSSSLVVSLSPHVYQRRTAAPCKSVFDMLISVSLFSVRARVTPVPRIRSRANPPASSASPSINRRAQYHFVVIYYHTAAARAIREHTRTVVHTRASVFKFSVASPLPGDLSIPFPPVDLKNLIPVRCDACTSTLYRRSPDACDCSLVKRVCSIDGLCLKSYKNKNPRRCYVRAWMYTPRICECINVNQIYFTPDSVTAPSRKHDIDVFATDARFRHYNWRAYLSVANI